MTQASGTRLNWGWAALLALILALLGGVARAESSPAAWAFDLLARVEPSRPIMRLSKAAGIPVPRTAGRWHTPNRL